MLYRILAHVLGPANCVQIGEDDLAKPYNHHYATKLLVFANELLDNHKRGGSLGDGLKATITDGEVFLESKGVARTPAVNRVALIAATNRSKPIELEESDRRWTVFHNRTKPAEYRHPDLGLSHRDFLESLHAPGTDDAFTPEFMRQVAAFAYEMSTRAVDMKRVRRPHTNASRDELQQLSEPVTEQFLRELSESPEPDRQLYNWATHVSNFASIWTTSTGPRVGKTQALTNDALFVAMVGFCKSTGQKHAPQKRTFLAALKAAGWVEQRDNKARGWLPPWHVNGSDAPSSHDAKVVPFPSASNAHPHVARTRSCGTDCWGNLHEPQHLSQGPCARSGGPPRGSRLPHRGRSRSTPARESEDALRVHSARTSPRGHPSRESGPHPPRSIGRMLDR